MNVYAKNLEIYLPSETLSRLAEVSAPKIFYAEVLRPHCQIYGWNFGSKYQESFQINFNFQNFIMPMSEKEVLGN